MIQGFKEFISRGNAIDLAVGMVIGAAFGAVVTALVDGIINPLLGAIFGQPNFDSVGAFELNGTMIMPGMVVTALINFLLIALAVYFLIVVPMNKLAERRAQGVEEEVVLSDEANLLAEIRDLLANNQQPRL